MRDWCSSWPPGSSRRSGASPRHGCQRPQIGADEVNPLTTSAFDLPDRLSAKADPALIAADEQHFAAIADSLEETIAGLSGRLDAERKAPGGIGQEAMDRDLEIHRLTARLRVLRRFGLDLCLGRIVSADSPEPVYIGRLGLTDDAGRRLLLDWRSPGAACCSSARTSLTWPTSLTCSPTSGRRGCRPAPWPTWSPREPRQHGRPTRTPRA